MMTYDCIIIGGGASGVISALSVRKHHPQAKILLLERQFQLLRKVQASGNGRCNLSNRNLKSENYFSVDSSDSFKQRFLQTAFNQFSFTSTKRFFLDLGIPLRIDEEGRAYPHSEQSAAVVLTLSKALVSSKIEVLLQAEVEKIDYHDNSFELSVVPNKTVKEKKSFEFLTKAKKIKCNKLILACGSKAAKNLGGSHIGYNLINNLAEISTLTPALVPLKLSTDINLKVLAGERFKGQARLFRDSTEIASSSGEFLFSKTGLSGIAGMELARFIPEKFSSADQYYVKLDFAPEYTQPELETILTERKINLQEANLNQLAIGLVKQKTATFLAESAESILQLSVLLKELRIDLLGTNGFENAQVVAGGVKLSQIYSPSFALKSNPAIYICGELMDLDGKTGGFNLQWAWTSGYLAGKLSEAF